MCARPASPPSLASVPFHRPARIVAIHADAATAHYLRAVGLREGETACVLRAALFGGPLHVRAECGGEFALARSLAECITVEISQ